MLVSVLGALVLSACLLLLARISVHLRLTVVAIFLFPPTVFYGAIILIWLAISKILPGDKYPLLDDFLWGWYQKFLLYFFETCTKADVTFYGDIDECTKRKENVLYISNHQTTMDWIIADMLAVRQGSVGHLRYMLKDQLLWVPLYGWGFSHHGCVYVRRDGGFRPDIAEKTLHYLSLLKGYPFWMIVYPEGSLFKLSHERFAELVAKGNKIAEQKGLRPLTQHYMPRVRGTQLILKHLKPSLDAVYDVTLLYEGSLPQGSNLRQNAPALLPWLSSTRPAVHVHVKRIPAERIPSGDDQDELTRWLHERFLEKDHHLNEFLTTRQAFASLPPGQKLQLPFTSTFMPALTFVLCTFALAMLPQLWTVYFVSLFLQLTGGYVYLWWTQVA